MKDELYAIDCSEGITYIGKMNRIEKIMGGITNILILRDCIKDETRYLFKDSAKKGETLYTDSECFDPNKALRTYQESFYRESKIEIIGNGVIHFLGDSNRQLAKPDPLHPTRMA
jgi:hypothetical protein